MATISIGSLGYQGNSAVPDSGNWNTTEQKIWSNTAAVGDGFYFANSTELARFGVAGNTSFAWNGAGGTDTIFLGTFADGGTATTAHTFNLSQLQLVGASQKYLVTGTTLGDAFNWDAAMGTDSGVYSLNGGLGTDTVQLFNTTAAVTFTMANISMSNIEFIAGSAAGEEVAWKGTGGFSFDLAGGTDTLNLTTATTAQDVRLSNLQFKNIEHLVGTALADTLAGSAAAVTEVFEGGAGTDILWGASGADSLKGGVGADTFYFGLGDGNDAIVGETADSKSDVVLFQGSYGTAAFADLSFAATASDLQIGINGVDSLTIQDWASFTTDATAKDNRISKFVASDLTFGLAMGNGTAGASLFGADTSMAYYMSAGAGGQTLKAGTTADTLIGGTGNDTFQFTSTSGAVLYDGKSTTDADLLTAETYSAGAVSVYLQNETTKYKNIENLTGSSMGDLLGGNSVANIIIGGKGADSIYGAAGNDALTGGEGADSYWFGNGNGTDNITDGSADNKDDAVIFWANSFSDLSFSRDAATSANYEITINGTTDKLQLLGAGTKTGTNTNSFNRVNKFITTDQTFGLTIGTYDGAATADTLKGTSIADYILGGDGNDSINGYAGVDAIYGQAGNDTIVYSDSSWIDGGAGTDVVTAEYATAGVSIELTASRITNVEKLIGSAYADKLGGTSAVEFLVGGDGADSIWGAGGNDTLEGGLGADSYWFGVGDGTDTIASGDYNNLDTVMFYGAGIGGGGITSTIVSGANLTIGLSSGDSLTLENWNGTAGQKVNKFYFEQGSGAGTYSLAVDGTNTATWTRLS